MNAMPALFEKIFKDLKVNPTLYWVSAIDLKKIGTRTDMSSSEASDNLIVKQMSSLHCLSSMCKIIYPVQLTYCSYKI